MKTNEKKKQLIPDHRENRNILLIEPPFSDFTSPYISIPTLAAYLKTHSIPVTALDLNNEFYHSFLTPERITRDKEYMEDRFLELNEKEQLQFSEMFEYNLIGKTLVDFHKHHQGIESSFLKGNRLKNLDESELLDICMRITTFPFFPDILVTQPMFRLISPFHEFSSDDILRSVDYRFFFSEVMENILTERLKSNPPFIAGISLVFENQLFPAFYCAAIIKRVAPHVHITMGGPFISLHMRELTRTNLFQLVDTFIIDEGEIPLEKLYNQLSSPHPDFTQVPNLVWQKNNRVIYNTTIPPLPLENHQMIDFSIYDLDRYMIPKEEMYLPFRLSRGCYWQKCSFCRTDMSFCKYYSQPPYEYVYQQLQQVMETTGVTNFHFTDESIHPKTMEYICKRLLEDNIHISWVGHTRVDKLLNAERSRLFTKTGCKRMSIGVESLNDRILKLMKKGTDTQLIYDVINEINGQLPLMTYMIVGFPSETEEEAMAGFDGIRDLLKKRLITGYYYSHFMISYGSDNWKNPEKYGITEIPVNPELDLCPDISNPVSSGMDARRSYALSLIMSNYLARKKIDRPIENIRIKDTEVPIKYDYRSISSIIKGYLYKDPFPLLNRWLEKGNSEVEPIKKGEVALLAIAMDYTNFKQ